MEIYIVKGTTTYCSAYKIGICLNDSHFVQKRCKLDLSKVEDKAQEIAIALTGNKVDKFRIIETRENWDDDF